MASRSRRMLACVIWAAASVYGGPASLGQGQTIIALVEDHPITVFEVDQRALLLAIATEDICKGLPTSALRQGRLSEIAKRPSLRTSALKQLVVDRLMELEVRRMLRSDNPDLNETQLEVVLANMFGMSTSEFSRRLHSCGMRATHYRALAETRFRWPEVVKLRLGGGPGRTSAQLEAASKELLGKLEADAHIEYRQW